MKHLLTAIGIAICVAGHAQYNQNLPEVKPLPPNAAELFKTVEKPLGTFTGTIPIDFPLCAVASGPLTATISLNYTGTGGIKVEELGGPVGLGFNLSDGAGKIVQMIKGDKADDVGGILFQNNIRPSNFGCTLNNVEEASMGKVDLEPDIFMYSFNGHSGRFYFRENGSVIMLKNDGINIQYNLTASGITSWVITDGQGNRYFFDRRSESLSGYSSISGESVPRPSSTTWSLNRIEDMNGQHAVTFTYTNSFNLFTTRSGSSQPIPAPQLPCINFNTRYEEGIATTEATEYMVSRIDAENGYVLFTSNFTGPNGRKRVDAIEQYDTRNIRKKRFTFNYGTPFSADRQKLLSFSEFGIGTTGGLETKFEYFEAENLPEPTSRSVDMWGYYNGAFNTSIIPRILYNSFLVGDAVRYARPEYAKANILTKIIYPTGGYRELEYEGNLVLTNGDFFAYHRHPEAMAPYLVQRNIIQTHFQYLGPDYPVMQEVFTINSTAPSTIFSYQLANTQFCNEYTVKVMRITDPSEIEGGLVRSFFAEASGSVVLQNGFYKIAVFMNQQPGCAITEMTGAWEESTLQENVVMTPYGHFSNLMQYAGGVRVKQVRDYDPVTNKVYKRDYKYKMYSTDSALSSGVLISEVNIIADENIQSVGCFYKKIAASGYYPLAAEGGSYVVYPEVRTIDEGNGFTDLKFSFAADLYMPVYPTVPVQDWSDLRGKLEVEKLYNEAGTLLKRKETSYSIEHTEHQQLGYRYKPYYFDFDSWEYSETRNDLNEPLVAAACQEYFILGHFFVPLQTSETDYTAPGNLTTTTVNVYGKLNDYRYVKTETTTDSKNEERKRSFRYAFTAVNEFELGLTAGEQSIRSTLLSKNFLQPLEVVERLGTSFVYGSKYIFSTFNGNRLYLNKFRLYSTLTDYNETNFSAYDNKGNLTEQHKPNDVKEVYLWGYNGAYPVAKITGTDYSTVLGLVNSAVLNNPASETALQTELNNLRSALASTRAQVTSYTYNLLYGMSSMTEPSGRTTYYEYDLFGRLRLVRDQDNNIIRQYEYKLKNHQ